MIGYIPSPPAPRDYIADPPRVRTFYAFGHPGAWAYPLPPKSIGYSTFRVTILFTPRVA